MSSMNGGRTHSVHSRIPIYFLSYTTKLYLSWRPQHWKVHVQWLLEIHRLLVHTSVDDFSIFFSQRLIIWQRRKSAFPLELEIVCLVLKIQLQLHTEERKLIATTCTPRTLSVWVCADKILTYEKNEYLTVWLIMALSIVANGCKALRT